MKTQMRVSPIILFFILTIISCKENKQGRSENITTDTVEKLTSAVENDTAQNDTLESKMIDTIFNLPEMKERGRLIEIRSDGKNHLSVWSTGYDPDGKYYEIHAGEDNGESYVTWDLFHVYPDSMRMMIYDISGDSEIELDTWRKTLKDR